MDISGLLSQSDLYERPGKDQHAFCLMIGRDPHKVRILCNCKDNAYWMGVMLHEFGHGVYFQHLDPKQNYLLRDIAHISTTEAMAMLFGRLPHSKAWLKEVLQLKADVAETVGDLAFRELSWQMLLFTRWVLVMAHFERDLYANPHQDLNRRWWDLVEKYQLLIRPEGRDMPDWAAKSHISQNPAYYQNYLLGELTVSQIQHYIQNRLGNLPLISQPKTGAWLQEKLFKQGALRPWNEALEYLTGEKLNPDYFLKEFVQSE
jgi:peptidyl-dipeptidase A